MEQDLQKAKIFLVAENFVGNRPNAVLLQMTANV